VAAEMSGLGIRYDLGAGHPLLGRRMPDLDIETDRGTQRAYTLLPSARPVLLNFGEPGSLDATAWADRVQSVDARYDGEWELPAICTVAALAGVLVRPDGSVCWVSASTDSGLTDALTPWFGAAAATT